MKVMLINVTGHEVYKGQKLSQIKLNYAPVGMASLAASIKGEVKVVDTSVQRLDLPKELSEFKPDVVGLSFHTVNYDAMKSLCAKIKKHDKTIKVITGGPHASAMPEETLEDTQLDTVVVGEGEPYFEDWDSYKDKRIARPPQVDNLDDLPMPAWEYLKKELYVSSKHLAKKSPVCGIETSRGCPFGCIYCNKSVFGRKNRIKSVKRVVQDIVAAKFHGFNEFMIIDDTFNISQQRVIEICDALIATGDTYTWTCSNGIRADNTSRKMLSKMKEAGCYRVHIGIESGNQKVLDGINKRITLEQVRKTVRLCDEIGITTVGYLMVGLPDDTEETMQETIDFAKSLPLDYAKFSIMVPQAGTPIWDSWSQAGYLTGHWKDFHYKPDIQLYKHPTLQWDTIVKYYDKAFRSFYFRPSYIARRIKKDIKEGLLWEDIKLAARTNW